MSAVKRKVRPSGMDGTWIDFTIVNGLGLTDQEKILFSMIFNLSKRKEGCTAGNSYFAEIMEKSEKAISEAISRMVRKGVIKIRLTKTKYGTARVMFANVKIQKPTPQPTSKATPQTEEPTPYGMDDDPQIVEATPHGVECMHSPEYGTDIKGIKEEHKKEIEKESLSHEGELSWLNVREKARELILRDWGEYDHAPEKEKSKLLQWEELQNKDNPKVVLEMIQKLIFIRKSKKFETDTFWQSRPVSISTAYSYKDHIKNTYEALLRLPDSGSTPKKQESNRVSVPVYRAEKQKLKRLTPYESFEDWASEPVDGRATRLTPSTIEIIRNSISVEDLPNSIRAIYNRFEVEEGRGMPLHSPLRKEAV